MFCFLGKYCKTLISGLFGVFFSCGVFFAFLINMPKLNYEKKKIEGFLCKCIELEKNKQVPLGTWICQSLYVQTDVAVSAAIP